MKTKPTPSPRPAKKLRRPMQLDGVAPQVAAAVHAQEAKKLPKAYVGFLVGEEMFYRTPQKHQKNVPYAMIEFSTPAEARAFARFWSLSEGERETKVSILIYRQFHGIKPHPEYERGYIENARQILALLAPNRRTKSEG